MYDVLIYMCLFMCIHTQLMYYIYINTYFPTTLCWFYKINLFVRSSVQLQVAHQIIYSGFSIGLAYSYPLLVWLDPQDILHSQSEMFILSLL